MRRSRAEPLVALLLDVRDDRADRLDEEDDGDDRDTHTSISSPTTITGGGVRGGGPAGMASQGRHQTHNETKRREPTATPLGQAWKHSTRVSSRLALMMAMMSEPAA